MVLNRREIIKPRIAAWFGVIAPIWAIVSIGMSIVLSPWFSWTDNALSDLGVSSIAPIFNSGLIVCGILASLFIFGLAKMERKNRLGLIGLIVLLLSSISLIGIGVFSEAFGVIHFCFSVLFFALFITSSTILGIHFAFSASNRKLGIFTLLVGAISFIGWVGWAIVRLRGVAIPETISAFMTFLLLAVLSIRMYRESVKLAASNARFAL